MLHDGGPLVVVAGAGSGKTRVLTRRIARLVASGVAPWRILAITFTNKAADEMRRRVVELVGADAETMWVSTFHSACVRMLRRNAERIGYRRASRSTTTATAAGSSSTCSTTSASTSGASRPGPCSGSSAPPSPTSSTPPPTRQRAGTIYERRIAQAYAEYERRLVAANAMDFDDLFVRTVRMFREHPDVLEQYQERFEHVLVDEYQDTNVAQNELVIQLGAKRRNVCVVGDTDQSIYRFRGAEMRNLLEFERAFPDATHDRARPELPLEPDDPRCRERRHRQQPAAPGKAALDARSARASGSAATGPATTATRRPSSTPRSLP